MASTQRLILGLLVASSCVASSSATKTNTLQVNTTVGTVQGSINSTFPNVAQYLNIPFAEPPLGKLRFAPPVPKAKVHSVIDGTMNGPACYQNNRKTEDIHQYSASGLNYKGPQSEDCLSISVWTPYSNSSSISSKLPVLVWIYGGGFDMGANAGIPYYVPNTWIQLSQDFIVVELNYRIDIFGFPTAAGLPLSRQNLGLLDQRLAMEWVRDNIEAFGGDRSRITLFGHSAGAISIDYYQYAYTHDPIISGFILTAGNAFVPGTATVNNYSNFTTIAEIVGCGNSSAKAQLACMRTVSAVDLQLAQYNYNATPALNFAPIADEKIVFSNYTARTLAGNFSKLPAIMGCNSDEGNEMVPFHPTGVNETLAHEYTLDGLLCPFNYETDLRYDLGVPTHRHLYDGNFSDISGLPWEGAYHAAELPLVFGTYAYNQTYPATAFEAQVSQWMQGAWLAFVKGGTQALTAYGWPAYKPNGQSMVIAANNVVAQNVSAQVLKAACHGQVGITGAVPLYAD